MPPLRVVRLGAADVAYGPGEFLQPAEDSAPLLRAGDFAALRAKLEEDGFLVLKGALPPPAVLAARSAVLDGFAASGSILDPTRDPAEGVLLERCGLGCVPFLEGRNDVTHSPTLLRVLEAPELRALFEGLLGESVCSFDYKWLRGVPRAGFTGAHVDAVYMARGSARLHTTWIPLDPAASLELGGLAMLRGSHRLPGFARLQATYGQLDVERDGLEGTGWFTNDPLELASMDPAASWRSCDYAAGDVVVFTLRTVHMSTANLTDRVRLSADVRWQPASEPADARYVGTREEVDPANRVRSGAWKADGEAGGAAGEGAKKCVTLPELRAAWGFTPGVSA